MADRDYTIEIILKARDEIAGVVSKVVGEVSGLQKLSEKSGFDRLDKDAARLSNTLRDKLSRELEKVDKNLVKTYGEVEKFDRKLDGLNKRADETKKALDGIDVDKTARELRKAEIRAEAAGRELDKLGKRTDQNGQEWDRYRGRLDRANQSIADHSTILKKAIAEGSRMKEITREMSATLGEHERALGRSEQAYKKQIDVVTKLRVLQQKVADDPVIAPDFDHASLDRQLKMEEDRARQAAKRLEDLSVQRLKPSVFDASATAGQMAAVEAQKKAISKNVHIDVDFDLAGATAQALAFEAVKGRLGNAPDGSFLSWVRQVGHEAEQSRSSIAAFDNAIRGMIVLGVIATAQQLLTVITALGGELVAVASSAVLAGGALGGALVTGAAQAMPIIGLLVGAFMRFGAVIEAVKQQQLVQEQQSYQGGKGAKAQASATSQLANANDGLRSAIEGVYQAKQNLMLAEVGLTKARFAATRQLEDLILREREAELAAKGASLSKIVSRASLQSAISQGRLTDIASAQLDVQSADIGAISARRDAQRARQDLRFQTSGSPLRPDSSVEDAERQVTNSRKALEAARRAVDSARRGIDQAKKSAAEAGETALASVGKFNYLLNQLSAAEKRLYYGVQRLYDTYKKQFGPITDLIVDSFTFTVNRINKLLNDPKMLSAFESLAGSIGGSIKRITGAFTSPGWVKFFIQMTREAAENLAPLTDAFLSINRAFRSIAIAAAPVLKDIVHWIKLGAESFEGWVGKGDDLRDFFKEGQRHLEAWGKLALALLELFGALIGTSSKEGLRSVQALTGEIKKATDWINSNKKETEAFFAEVGEVMSTLGEVLLLLGREIFRAFDPEAVAALGDILMSIVIPALAEAIILFGKIIIKVDELTKNPMVNTIGKWVIAFAVAKKVLDPFVGLLQLLATNLVHVTRLMGGLAARLAGASTAAIATQGPLAAMAATLGVSVGTLILIPALVLAAAAAFVFLADKFGVLDDIGRAFAEGWEKIKDAVGPALKDLGESLNELGEALGIVGGKSSGLGKIFRFLFVTFVKGVLIPNIEAAAEVIAAVLGGALEFLSGLIQVITGILTLNFDKIIEGAGKMVKGFSRPFRALAGIVWDRLKDILGVVIKGIGRIFGWMIDRAKDLPGLWWRGFTMMVKLFASLPGRLLGALKSAFPVVWNWLKGLPGRFVNAGKDVAEAFAEGVGRLPDLLANAFKGATEFIGKLAGSITEFINDNTPFGNDIDVGLFSVSLPKLPEKFEEGGPIGRGFGGGDKVHILAEEGEHMWTKDEVRNAGGHAAMRAMRAMFGRGGQSSGPGYAEGGKIKGGRGQAGVGIGAATGFEELLGQLISFGGRALDLWNEIWDSIQKRTASGVAAASNRFRELQKVGTAQTAKLEGNVKKSFNDLLRAVRSDMSELDRVVYKGFSYVAKAANQSLSLFGGKKVELNIDKPPGERKASGGFIGNMGERGRDAIATWLGRGEAVLNWGHQKIVDPALRAVYGFGLGDMFQRTQGEHAGGGMPGFSGGFAGLSPSGNKTVPIPGFPGEYIAQQVLGEALALIKRFRLFVTDAFATAGHSGPGHLFTGTAMDVVPGGGGSWDLVDKAVAYARSKGMTVLYNGVPDHGRGHHAHIELISGAIKGAIAAANIPKFKVKGTKGALKEIAQGAIDAVRKQALKKVGSTSMSPGVHNYGEGVLSSEEVRGIIQKAEAILKIPRSIRAAWTRMAMARAWQESAFNPSAINNWDSNAAAGHPSQGLFQTIPETFNAYKLPGFGGITNPLASAIAAFRYMRETYGGGNWAAALQAMLGKAGEGYASGGVIGGAGGAGRPIPILAHLGEWVLNPRQQLRVAKMLGTTVDKLKGMLGFSGGPSSFAGGGEPKGGGKETPEFGLRGSLRASFFDGTYAEEIAQQVEDLVTKTELITKAMAVKLARASVQLDKAGKRVIGRGMQADQLIQVELRQLNKGLTLLFGQQGEINKLIRATKRELKIVRADKTPAIHKAMQELREAQKDGDKKELEAAREKVKKAKEDRRAAEKTIKDTKRGLEAKGKSVGGEIAEKQREILEKMEAALQARVDEINNKASRGLARVSTRQNFLSAMGFGEEASSMGGQEIGILQNQKGQLEGALSRARQQHNRELAEQIEGEIEDIGGQITETVAGMFQAAQDSVEKVASRERFGIELRSRLVEVQERFGNLPGVQQQRGGILQAEGGSIRNQLGAQQALLSRALAEGFGPDIVDPLRERIEDLTVQLVENEAAIYSNTIAVRQAFIDQIQNRQGFIGGIFGSLEGIVNSLGALSGTVNQNRIIQLLTGAGNQLGQTGTGLRDQLVTFVGERLASSPFGAALMALAGQKGESLVEAIQHLDFEGIINTLGPEGETAKQFEALINAILENELALLKNTEQLEEASKNNKLQSFTSTAWQWFRKAIFTGMGGLTPAYAEGTPFYEAATGGEMLSDGAIKAHKGELIIPANFSAMLRRLVGAQALASDFGSGVLPQTPLGLSVASQAAGIASAELASAATNPMAEEISALRRELAARTQQIIVERGKDEPVDDATYLANKMAFAVRTPST